jgi:hypothetical protein
MTNYVPTVRLDDYFNPQLTREPGVVAEEPPEFLPTEFPPGSDEKIEVMAWRFEMGLPVCHPQDNKDAAVMKVGIAGTRGGCEKVTVELNAEDREIEEDPYDYE